jgi:hypothetical protein
MTHSVHVTNLINLIQSQFPWAYNNDTLMIFPYCILFPHFNKCTLKILFCLVFSLYGTKPIITENLSIQDFPQFCVQIHCPPDFSLLFAIILPFSVPWMSYFSFHSGSGPLLNGWPFQVSFLQHNKNQYAFSTITICLGLAFLTAYAENLWAEIQIYRTSVTCYPVYYKNTKYNSFSCISDCFWGK